MKHNKSKLLAKFGTASLALLLALGAGAPLTGCASDNGDGENSNPKPDSVGSLGIKLKVAPGVTLLTVSYSITRNAFSKSGSIDVGDSPTVSGTIGGIPAGNGYTITLSATSVEDETTFTGSANFDVSGGQTTPVTINLTAPSDDDTGGVAVNGNVAFEGIINLRPRIDELTIAPLTVFVGGEITLEALASDADNGPATLSYAWSATGGVIASPAAPSTTLRSSAEGTVTITLTVSDGGSTTTKTTTVNFVP
jgi:hypothetical protein